VQLELLRCYLVGSHGFMLFYGNSIWQATDLKSRRSDEFEHCCKAVRWIEISTTASLRSEILAPEFSVVVHPMLSLVASYQAGETYRCLMRVFFFKKKSDYHPLYQKRQYGILRY
jgi:hypothetical protein